MCKSLVPLSLRLLHQAAVAAPAWEHQPGTYGTPQGEGKKQLLFRARDTYTQRVNLICLVLINRHLFFSLLAKSRKILIDIEFHFFEDQNIVLASTRVHIQSTCIKSS